MTGKSTATNQQRDANRARSQDANATAEKVQRIAPSGRW